MGSEVEDRNLDRHYSVSDAHDQVELIHQKQVEATVQVFAHDAGAVSTLHPQVFIALAQKLEIKGYLLSI